MKDRRPLSEGIHAPVDPEIARKFIRGENLPAGDEDNVATSVKPASSATQNLARVPLSTRIRGDYFGALKRASLERQLSNIEPHTLIEILEQAVEPWLKSNGYIK
jgi:hypothetical protein